MMTVIKFFFLSPLHPRTAHYHNPHNSNNSKYMTSREFERVKDEGSVVFCVGWMKVEGSNEANEQKKRIFFSVDMSNMCRERKIHKSSTRKAKFWQWIKIECFFHVTKYWVIFFFCSASFGYLLLWNVVCRLLCQLRTQKIEDRENFWREWGNVNDNSRRVFFLLFFHVMKIEWKVEFDLEIFFIQDFFSEIFIVSKKDQVSWNWHFAH